MRRRFFATAACCREGRHRSGFRLAVLRPALQLVPIVAPDTLVLHIDGSEQGIGLRADAQHRPFASGGGFWARQLSHEFNHDVPTLPVQGTLPTCRLASDYVLHGPALAAKLWSTLQAQSKAGVGNAHAKRHIDTDTSIRSCAWRPTLRRSSWCLAMITSFLLPDPARAS